MAVTATQLVSDGGITKASLLWRLLAARALVQLLGGHPPFYH